MHPRSTNEVGAPPSSLPPIAQHLIPRLAPLPAAEHFEDDGIYSSSASEDGGDEVDRIRSFGAWLGESRSIGTSHFEVCSKEE